jgi:hypothetical protein
MMALAGPEEEERPLPNPKLIWLKARLAQQASAMHEVLKPLEIFQRIAWAISVLTLMLGLLDKWLVIERAMSRLASDSAAIFSAAGVPVLFPIFLSLVLSVFGLTLTFTLYTLFCGTSPTPARDR